MAVTRSTYTRNTYAPSSIPSWLYELLPFIYIIGGLLAIAKLDGGFAALSSALLIFAGVRILSLRRSYRKAAAKPRRTYGLKRR